MLTLQIDDETSTLDTVVLGIGEDMAGPEGQEPKSEFHLRHDSWPTRADVLRELGSLESALISAGVKILRPINLRNLTQIFARDLGFVIGDTFFVGQMSEDREREQQGIAWLLELIDGDRIVDLRALPGVDVEGGDVLVRGGTIFVGRSERTNDAGYEFLRDRFRDRKVVQLELQTDPDDHTVHTLHLDCTFQPVGPEHAIVYEGGVRNLDALYANLPIPRENVFRASKWQFVRMFPNILSLGPDRVIVERQFIELRYWLEDRGFQVTEVDFRQISRMGGLLRCATLPLRRRG